MGNQFPGWTFAGGGQLSGTLTVNSYAAAATASQGGASISIAYSPGPNDPPLASLHWIQVIWTNEPLGGATSPYVDPVPNDDNLPFYWTLSEDGSMKNGSTGAYSFSDAPSRGYPPPPDAGVSSVSWGADLYLCSWDGQTTVTIYDGVNWGWYIEQYPMTCMRSHGHPVQEEHTTQLSSMYPFILVGWPRRRRAGRSSIGRFHGPITAVLIIVFVLALPQLAHAQKSSKGGGSQIASLALKLEKATYRQKDTEPIKAQLTFRNRLFDESITIWSSGFWTNHRLIVKDERGKESLELTDLGKKYMGMFSPKGGPRDKNAPIVVPPGESHIERVPGDLKQLYKFKPGKYTLQVLYEDTRPPTPLRVFSNRVEFTIE